MHNTEKRIRWMAVALLVLFALLTDDMPNIGDKNIVRCTLVEQTERGYTVSFLYQRSEPEANAADAQEKLRFASGSGESLPQAYTQAEAQLTGPMVYSLCDLLLFTGKVDVSCPQMVLDYVAESGCGRLSARIALLDEIPDAWKEKEAPIEQIYSALFEAAEDAPELYEAASETVLLPCLRAEEERGIKDGAILTDLESLQFRMTDQEGALFRIFRSGFGKTQIDLDNARLTLRCIRSYQWKRDHLEETLYVFVTGFPEEPSKRQEMQAKLAAQMQESYRRFSQCDTELGYRWSGAQKMVSQKYGEKADFSILRKALQIQMIPLILR